MPFPRHAILALALSGEVAIAAPSLIIVNAHVFTADPAQPRAEAVAVEDGLFSAVGGNAQIRALASPATRVIDAGGRLATPGLIETHVHLGSTLPSAPLLMPGLPFPGPTPEQALAAVAAAARTSGDWISAWIGPLVARDQRNWRVALDAVAPNRPVLLRGFWGHTAIVNSAALLRIGIAEDVADPIGGHWRRDAAGRLNGRADEGASPVPEIGATPNDPAKLAPSFQAAAQRYARWGVTSIHLMNSGKTLEVTLDTLAKAETPQKWTVYSWATGAVPSIAGAWSAMDAAPKTLPLRVRIDGPKWMLDGTPIEQNALRREPYAGRPDWRGRSNHSDAQLREILQTALRRPGQVSLHVVGDAETDRVFAMMESLASADAWREKRVRIEHGDGIRDDTLAQAARLGVVVIQNPTHFPPAGAPRRPAEPHSMLKSLLAAGVPIALGSDAGAEEANPFLNIMLATTYAAFPPEALSREQALLAYTAGAAYAEKQERSKGRIGVGMAADLALLSQDILSVPLAALPATRSLLTLVDGDIVFEDPTLTDTSSPK
ncbi:amidohydrolase [Variovorax saccharolyticus]|uniref:amidohydrolase n=1 Tax=Variovorax saccharolyticus TaxID=3053516 RepID=UPI002574B0A4|nr:amidohydrolase family protein [Variovorax sp. J22R187]MDM0022360.1 amidohydrolase family protein [Variovorax sp. J22R187]